MQKIAFLLAYRFYQCLLTLYPADFRREYGPDMAQLFRDSYHHHTYPTPFHFWFTIITDFIKTLCTEHLEVFMSHRLPYLWQAARIMGISTTIGITCGMLYALLTATCCLAISLIWIGGMGGLFGLLVSLIIIIAPTLHQRFNLSTRRLFIKGAAVSVAILTAAFTLPFTGMPLMLHAFITLIYAIGGAIIGAALATILIKAPALLKTTN